jgi:hypothetical protein
MRGLTVGIVACLVALGGSPALADKSRGTDKQSGNGASPGTDRKSGGGSSGDRVVIEAGRVEFRLEIRWDNTRTPSNDVRDPSGGGGGDASRAGAPDFSRGSERNLSSADALKQAYDFTSSMPAPLRPSDFKRDYNREVRRGIVEGAVDYAHAAHAVVDTVHKHTLGAVVGVMTDSSELGKDDEIDPPAGRTPLRIDQASPRGYTPSPRH